MHATTFLSALLAEALLSDAKNTPGSDVIGLDWIGFGARSNPSNNLGELIQ